MLCQLMTILEYFHSIWCSISITGYWNTWIVPTTYSDNKAMIKVIPTNQANPLQNPITAASSGTSSSSSDSCPSGCTRIVSISAVSGKVSPENSLALFVIQVYIYIYIYDDSLWHGLKPQILFSLLLASTKLKKIYFLSFLIDLKVKIPSPRLPFCDTVLYPKVSLILGGLYVHIEKLD
jgi:hypothetical protein